MTIRDHTQEEAESMVDNFYSQAEELQAEIDSRTEALQEYIDDEEYEIGLLAHEAMKLNAMASDLQKEYGIGD